MFHISFPLSFKSVFSMFFVSLLYQKTLRKNSIAKINRYIVNFDINMQMMHSHTHKNGSLPSVFVPVNSLCTTCSFWNRCIQHPKLICTICLKRHTPCISGTIHSPSVIPCIIRNIIPTTTTSSFWI